MTPAAYRVPSSSSTTTRRPMGRVSSRTSQTVRTLSCPAPGSRSTSGFTLEKPVREGTAPVATITASGASSRTSSDVASVPSRTSTVPAELPFEVACDPAELVAAGRPQNQVYLAPELVLALDECHPVAALRKDGRGLHPCRPAAGHEPARRLIARGDRPRAESPLASGTRIDGAVIGGP